MDEWKNLEVPERTLNGSPTDLRRSRDIDPLDAHNGLRLEIPNGSKAIAFFTKNLMHQSHDSQ